MVAGTSSGDFTIGSSNEDFVIKEKTFVNSSSGSSTGYNISFDNTAASYTGSNPNIKATKKLNVTLLVFHYIKFIGIDLFINQFF